VIGVVANAEDHDVVAEFFELFKTPWDWFCADGEYDVLLISSDNEVSGGSAKLTLHYAGHEMASDRADGIQVGPRSEGGILEFDGERIPVYGEYVTFADEAVSKLRPGDSNETSILQRRVGGRTKIRVGCDLFAEIRTLLTTGQPAAYAQIPTLDAHIGLLRDLIVSNGIELVEIPPTPDGYKFIACLTHDIDHPSIASHRCDRTAVGFCYRATLGSLIGFLSGRNSWRAMLRNWTAALRLPFVYLGAVKDFWSGFADRYRKLEGSFPSTWFVIPFAGRPGRQASGSAPNSRGAGYGAKDIAGSLRDILASGNDVGLHGIDAWVDPVNGRLELQEVCEATESKVVGARMHWLFFDKDSAASIEKSGVEYDSTFGYRETVGFRAGTAQVYKPLNAKRLLELPLHIMDTALFYPAYLNLTQRQAAVHLRPLVDSTVRFGGCLTINWHDRSLAPERNWDVAYVSLLDDLNEKGAWFATAGQVTSWFRMRRSVTFIRDDAGQIMPLIKQPDTQPGTLPGLVVRVHNAPEREMTEQDRSQRSRVAVATSQINRAVSTRGAR